MQCSTPIISPYLFSNSSTWRPRMNEDSRITDAIAASISSRIVRYCAYRSTNSIFPLTLSELEWPDETRGISRVNARLGKIVCDNGSRPHDDAISDGHGQNRRIGSDRDVIPKSSRFPFRAITAGGPAIGEHVIDEHRSV